MAKNIKNSLSVLRLTFPLNIGFQKALVLALVTSGFLRSDVALSEGIQRPVMPRRAPANTITSLANKGDSVSPTAAAGTNSGASSSNAEQEPKLTPQNRPMLRPMVPVYSGRIAILGSEILFLKSSASMGVLYGWKYLSFESESFGIGGAGYTGQMSGGVSGSFSFGGMVADFTGSLSRTIDIDFSILAGGGGGLLTSGVGEGGVVLSPSLGLTFILGKAVRTSVSGLYVYMPSAPSFTAYGGSMRFEFKLPQ